MPAAESTQTADRRDAPVGGVVGVRSDSRVLILSLAPMGAGAVGQMNSGINVLRSA